MLEDSGFGARGEERGREGGGDEEKRPGSGAQEARAAGARARAGRVASQAAPLARARVSRVVRERACGGNAVGTSSNFFSRRRRAAPQSNHARPDRPARARAMAGGNADLALLAAAQAGDAAGIRDAIACGGDPGTRGEEGVTPLMLAAAAGSREGVAELLAAGAVWHDLDEGGNSAGEYASGSGHAVVVRDLLDAAIRAELVLGMASRRSEEDARRADERAESRDYLAQNVVFQDGKILDQNGEAVMMDWEAPLMRRHAEIICSQVRASRGKREARSRGEGGGRRQGERVARSARGSGRCRGG